MNSSVRKRLFCPEEEGLRSEIANKKFIDKSVIIGKPFMPEIYKSTQKRTKNVKKKEDNNLLESKDLDFDLDLNICINSEAAHIRSLFPIELFSKRLPPIILYSQLYATVEDKPSLSRKIEKLVNEGKILTFSIFSASNYLVVLTKDFFKIQRKGLFQKFSDKIQEELSIAIAAEGEKSQNGITNNKSLRDSAINSSEQHIKLFTKQELLKKWRLSEPEIRQLVNGGYLAIYGFEIYSLSLPSGGEFAKVYEKGRKAVIRSIKKAKFQEILQRELEQRPMKKSAPLGLLYHIYDLIGCGTIKKLDTTSGPLLRISSVS